MDITDEELRKQLANYMDNVPPVTGSTREVLKVKLAKYISSETLPKSYASLEKDSEKRTAKRQTIATSASSTNSYKTDSAGDNLVSGTPVEQNPPEKRRKINSALPRSASPEKRQSALMHTSPSLERSSEKPQSSPQSFTAPLLQTSLNKSCNGESILYEDDECRIRYFPSSEMPEYPGGVPVFRRRSLHPVNDKEQTSNPYEEFYIRSPRLQAKIDAERIISRVMSGSSRPSASYCNTKYREDWTPSSGRKSLFKMPSMHLVTDFISGAFLGLCALVLAPFALVRGAAFRLRSVVNCKTISFIFLICILAALAIFFIYSDPFYRNPVAEFADRLSGPLASFLQTEN